MRDAVAPKGRPAASEVGGPLAHRLAAGNGNLRKCSPRMAGYGSTVSFLVMELAPASRR